METVVIFRLGSLGDTVVSLPCFHLIARRFPDARRVLLTNYPVSAAAAPSEAILLNGGFIHQAVRYEVGERRLSNLLRLRRTLRELGGDTLIYLNDPKSFTTFWRDATFFRLCGFRRFIGGLRTPGEFRAPVDPHTGEQRPEAERLARQLRALGPIDLADPSNWDLNLTREEMEVADDFLQPLANRPFIAVNAGGKIPVKDWGEANWRRFLTRLSQRLPCHGLIVIGAAEDDVRATRFCEAWPGPVLNGCGRLSARGSAAVLRRAQFFVGHDSGPLHLAAAVGVPCVGIFGEHNRPKRWHPVGPQHRIIHNLAGVAAISPDPVLRAAEEILAEQPSPEAAPRRAAP